MPPSSTYQARKQGYTSALTMDQGFGPFLKLPVEILPPNSQVTSSANPPLDADVAVVHAAEAPAAARAL